MRLLALAHSPFLPLSLILRDTSQKMRHQTVTTFVLLRVTHLIALRSVLNLGDLISVTQSRGFLFQSHVLEVQVCEGVISASKVVRISECGTGVRMPVPSE